MPTLPAARHIAEQALLANSRGRLRDLLREASSDMGCRFFALSHHVDFLAGQAKGVRVHNYPAEWAHWFDAQRLGVSDPVHRASQRTAAGFLWHDIPRFVPLAPRDEEILMRARRHGIGDGLTIPAHIPGEAHGSCSFAWQHGEATPECLAFAQVVGSFAFEAARRLDHPGLKPRPRLTERQRECVLWVARGKTDWEIAQILGVRHGTVIEHLRNARERYDATTRVTLTVRALFDGDLSFSDIAAR